MPHASLHAIVHGRVQGVFFRARTRDEALRLGIRGWVRNCADGTVEVNAVGERDRLEALLSWLHQGSDEARVMGVDVQWGRTADAPTGFTITG